MYNADTAKYARKALGDYGELSGYDVFAQAEKDTEAWAEESRAAVRQRRSLKPWRMPAMRI